MYIPPFAELITRYIYFELGVKKILDKKRKSTRPLKKITIKEIEEKLKFNKIQKGHTIMVHSSLRYIDEKAEDIIEFLMEYIGSEGNILMPTHPKLDFDNGNLVYDITQSPSKVGYLTEVFRKSKNVKRSMHPFSSVAVWGKEQDYLLADNLNDNKPLPHGKTSPYFKMTELNASVVCIGVSARGCATIRHVAEEVMDMEYPVKDLFKEYEIIIKDDGNMLSKSVVRMLDLRKSKIFVAKYKIVKEWLTNGILIRDSIEDVPFEIVDSKKCVGFMVEQAKRGNTSYPFAKKKSQENISNKNYK